MENINICNTVYRADTIPFAGINIMVIQGGKGMLGCGYLNLAAAEKFGHALAIVSGVANYEDMLCAVITGCSSAAAELGVTPGMTGKDALLLMK